MRTFHDIIWVGNLCWSTQHRMIEQDQGPSHETMAFTVKASQLQHQAHVMMKQSCGLQSHQRSHQNYVCGTTGTERSLWKWILLTEYKYHHGNFPKWSFNKPEEQLLKLVSVVSWNMILMLAIPYIAIYHVYQTGQYWAYLAYCTSFLVSFTATISLLAKSMLAFAVVAVTVLSLYPPVAVFLAFGDVVR